MRWLWRLILFLTFVSAALISAVAYMDNDSLVVLKFLNWQSPSVSIYWWLLLALTVGFISGALVVYAGSVKVRLKERKSRRVAQT